jgi:hypothetical protein
MGSQSLRKSELDARREIGIIVNDPRIAGKVRTIFEADWQESVVLDKANEKKVLAADDDKDKEKDKDQDKEKAKEKVKEAMAAASAG